MKITNYKIADNFKIKKQVKEKDEIIKEYDLIGFGSGIYYYKPHKKLRKFVESMDDVENKKAFHFYMKWDGGV